MEKDVHGSGRDRRRVDQYRATRIDNGFLRISVLLTTMDEDDTMNELRRSG